MKTRVMLDLETFGSRPGAVIVALGAVKFGEGAIYEEFYRRIDARSCEAAGLRLDSDTVLWWLGKSEEARAELRQQGEPLRWVLDSFSAWLGDHEAEIWGNGPSFDCTILAEAYHAVQLPLPWDHRNERCCRTMAALRPEITYERTGTLHNALEDARSQAVRVMKIFASLPSAGTPSTH